MQPRIMYIEQKTGDSNARIGLVKFSKTGKTIYYHDKVFTNADGRGIHGNYYGYTKEEWELIQTAFSVTGMMSLWNKYDEYWISGPKKNGEDRLYQKPIVYIDENIREEYWTKIRNKPEYVNQEFYK